MTAFDALSLVTDVLDVVRYLSGDRTPTVVAEKYKGKIDRHMKLSIVSIYIIDVFAFCFFVTFRAQRNRSINTQETFGVYGFLGAFGLRASIPIIMGIKELHVPLMDLLLQMPDLSRIGSFKPIPKLL